MRKLTTTLVILSLAAAGCSSGDSPSEDFPFDRAFIDAMVPHHQQAIDMAREAKTAGLSQPVLVEIADAILSTQQAEIDRMLALRAEWFGSSKIEPDGAANLGLSMEDMGMAHSAPYFESATDINSAFASMMIAHHEGAIEMAELTLDRADHQEIHTLGQAIIDAQQAEIEAMTPLVDPNSMQGIDHD